MNLIEELIATGNAKREDFEISYTGVFERVGAVLADDSSELSRKVASAQRRPSVAWSEMSQQVMGAERPPRDYLFVTYG
jgi:hypothetical protein